MQPSYGLAGTVIVIQGQDFANEGEVLLMEPGMAPSNSDMHCDVLQWTDAEVTCRLPELTAGPYEVRVRVPFLGDAVVPIPFVIPLSIEKQDLQEVNMAGGEELNFSGTGLGDAKVSVTLCGARCELLNITKTELRCRTMKILTSELEGLPSEDLRPFVHLTGSPHRQVEVIRAADGSVDADVQLDNEGPCHLDFDAGPGRHFHLTDVAYFAPAQVELREGLVGASFQSGDYPVLTENYTVEYMEEINPSDCPNDTDSNDSFDKAVASRVLRHKCRSFQPPGSPSGRWDGHRWVGTPDIWTRPSAVDGCDFMEPEAFARSGKLSFVDRSSRESGVPCRSPMVARWPPWASAVEQHCSSWPRRNWASRRWRISS